MKVGLSALAILATSTSFAQQGSWFTGPSGYNRLAIHMILLPNKKLLIMNRSRTDSTTEFDFSLELIEEPYTSPGTTFSPINEHGERELFCAGHTLDANGNVIFSGGHEHLGSAGDNHGIKDMWMYK